MKPLNSLTTRYGCIISDPPWPEIGGGKIKRGADRHYPVMSVKEIAELPVNQIAADDCHLYLWTTNNYLEDAFDVIKAWGFQYITLLTWVKIGRPGLGQYFRGATEHVLFCRKGCPPYRLRDDGKRAQGLTYFEAPRGEHSVKPEHIHGWAEQISPGPYLEMFARRGRPGWDTWGLEAPMTATEVNQRIKEFLG